MRSPWVRGILLMAGVLLLGALGVGIWPTVWRDRTVAITAGTFTARQHRVTGEVDVLCVDGWRRLAVDPFADLAYPRQTAAEKADPCLSAPYVKPPVIGAR